MGKRLRAGVKRVILLCLRALGTVFGDFMADGDHIGGEILAGVVLIGVTGRTLFGVLRSRRMPGVTSFMAVLRATGFLVFAERSTLDCSAFCESIRFITETQNRTKTMETKGRIGN